MKPQEIAERTAELIQREDRASRWLGMELEAIGLSYRRLAMRVAEHMLNAQEVCHGGLLFGLAEAREAARAGRTSVYDVRVTNQDRRTIALFRGKAATVKGHWLQ
jgi:acyl-CoA thioesterase